MSTHRLGSRRYKSFRLPVFLVLAWLIISLQVGISSTALAASDRATAPNPPQDVTRAGVSVVRLLLSYTGTDSTGPEANTHILCTGLGVLVRSQLKSNNPDQYENWVLTDGTLVNTESKATCMPSTPAATLSQVSIYTSSLYNAQQIIKFDVKASDITVHCPADAKSCVDGPTLFSFASGRQEPQPFIDLATGQGKTATDGGQSHALILARSDGSLNGLQASAAGSVQQDTYVNQLVQYRTPTARPQDDKNLEMGTPLVNQAGEMVGLHSAHNGVLAAATLQPFLDATLPKINNPSVVSPVYDNWKKGMDAYYQQMLNTAHTDFKNAFVANGKFQAAQQMALAGTGPSVQLSRAGGTPTPPPANGFSIPGMSFTYWLFALLAIVVVVVVLVLLWFWRRRIRQQRRLDSELADAEQRATIEAQRIRLAEMEAAQSKGGASQTGPLPAQPAVLKTGPLGSHALHCPRCGERVTAEDNFCTYCQQPLIATDSGSIARSQVASSASPNGGAYGSAAQASPPRSTGEQTTVVPARAIAEQPTIVPGRSIAEQPTVDMPVGSEQTTKLDPDKTVPYAVRQLSGRRPGIVASALSNPGIKRKYKPNEDSLFAMQGLISGSQKPPMFGLFVVADGMGGHANGEDASRTAIQAVVNYMLPKLVGQGLLQDESYARLMAEGAQEANLAVHQHNMQQNGDMGTTITAALVVDSTAYVVNVGDSRTYLYRPASGLRKITTDHSVVASLVDAGIIKPDDIYTHPKRNQIYRSLGEKPVIEVDSFKEVLQPGDKLLLCSDGLWDMVRDPKIEAVVRNPDPDPAIVSEGLIKAALDGGGEDNVSVIVVHITEPVETTGMPRTQLIAKPDSVQMPHLQ
ncbi:PP2C family serine/threonine-protein phosphatase [Dictyobacter aurantiacus]|nr:protein phosphatase 2C domain-containing protein [Dictyobacter aurantiacus]